MYQCSFRVIHLSAARVPRIHFDPARRRPLLVPVTGISATAKGSSASTAAPGQEVNYQRKVPAAVGAVGLRGAAGRAGAAGREGERDQGEDE
jgi:hypothetical protein